MTTLREAATRQQIEKLEKFGDQWFEHQEFVQRIIKQRFGMDCILVDIDIDEELLYLVDIHDTEFDSIYIKLEKFSNGVVNCYHIFDVFRWTEGYTSVRDSIELLRLLAN